MKKVLIGLFIISSLMYGKVVDNGVDTWGTYVVTQHTVKSIKELRREGVRARAQVLNWVRDNMGGTNEVVIVGGGYTVDPTTNIVTRKFYIKLGGK